MLVTCECGAKYRYDEKKFQGVTEKKADCPKCGRTIVISNPDVFSTKMHEEVLDDHVRKLDKPKYSLTVLRGPEAGQVFQLDQPTLTIGRMGADVIIEDSEASRVHAELRLMDDKVILRDLNSSNGTFIKGERINEVILEDDTEFTIGQTLFALYKILVSFD
jgi:hypothetical protein